MNRLEELLEYLESTDISRLQRWDDLGYQEFRKAVDNYCEDKDYDCWRDLLGTIAKMVKAARAGVVTSYER